MKVLFVTWDGADGGYLAGLYFQLFAELAHRAINVRTLQFTWAPPERISQLEQIATKLSLGYRAVRVPAGQGGVSALKTLPRAAIAIRDEHADSHFDVLMPRSLIPGAMALLARVPSEMVFDADGMMHEERVDFGTLSRRSPVYWALRAIERRAARRSAKVIVRSEHAARMMIERAGIEPANVHVAYNGRSTTVYQPRTHRERLAARREMQVPENSPLILYVGSLGPKYGVATMVQILAHLMDLPESAHLRVFARPSEHRDDLLRPLSRFATRIRASFVDERQLAELMPAADLGLALITPALSTSAVFPVKVAEYALCGVPTLSSRDVGDLEQLSRGRPRAVFTVDQHSPALDSLTLWFRENAVQNRELARSESRALGEKYFSLERMADQFQRALQVR